jgi:hypothetical protein
MTNNDSLSTIPHRVIGSSVIKNNNYPELYIDALPEIKFFILLTKLMTICGNTDFGFKDLQLPQSKRFKLQLSAVINFLKFKEDMQHLVEQGQDEVRREKGVVCLLQVVCSCYCCCNLLLNVVAVGSNKSHAIYIHIFSLSLCVHSARNCLQPWMK